MPTPRVFVSHSSKDKQRFVIPFAKRLRESGVGAWVDTWEIEPGDSLVEKIFDEGIEQADAVIIVVSEHSAAARWVRAELDHAFVRGVEDRIRLIPVVLGDCEVPVPLRSKRWVKISDLEQYDDAFAQIVDTLHGRTPGPPVGDPPSYVETSVPSVHGLSNADVLLYKVLMDSALANNSKRLGGAEAFRAAGAAGIPESVASESVEALAAAGVLKAQKMPTDDSLRFVEFEDRAFLRYLKVFHDIQKLTTDVGCLVVNESVRNGIEIAERLSMHPMLIFAFIEHLGARRLMEVQSHGDGNARFGKVVEVRNVSPQFRRDLE